MKRRGFTFVELMVACSISIIVMGAMMGLFFGVWTLAKGAADELEGALSARLLRETLFYRLKSVKVNGTLNDFGLINASEISLDSRQFRANFTAYDTATKAYKTISFATVPNDADPASASVGAVIDWNPTAFKAKRTWDASTESLKCVYLKKTYGKTTYYDRLVAPIRGKRTATTAEIQGVFQ